MGVRVAHAHHEPRIPQGDGQDDRAAQRQPGCLFPTHPYSWQPRVELLRLQRLCDSVVGENARGIEPSMPCRSAHIASHNAARLLEIPHQKIEDQSRGTMDAPRGAQCDVSTYDKISWS